MTTSPGPGLRNQAGARTFFRVAGCLLAPLGAIACVYGFVSFAQSDDMGSPLREVGFFLGGFLVFAIGMMFVHAGFAGVAVRYGAGETMPVVKDSASYLSDGKGIMNVGRTAPAAATGPYCRTCGARNDDDARFCDGCGGSLA